jgi:GGDEF domain-containing protein
LEAAVNFFDRIPSESLDRREMHLIILACAAIMVLAGGLALFMYPVVFSQTAISASRTMSIVFCSFCALSMLLALYLLDRQATIGRLRQQIREERSKASHALTQASAELLGALPNFRSFQDQLSMEYRREAAAKQSLSVLVIATRLHQAFSEPSLSMSVLGDAAKAISRKLRTQDSVYLLTHGYFGVIVPGADTLAAQKVSARLVEGLTDAAGLNNRFSFKVCAISFPEQAPSARDLELAVADLLPQDSSNPMVTIEAL